MDDTMKINTYKRFLISKNNIIVEVNKNLLDITGYTESELLGLTLVEASKLLRVDSQITLEDMEDDTPIFIFTKKLVAIEVTISCKTTDCGKQKLFLFKRNLCSLANERFNLINEFGTSQGSGVAIFSYTNFVLVNSNQYFLNFLEPPFNKRLASIGKSLMEISSGYLEPEFDMIRDYVLLDKIPYHIEEMYVDSRSLGESYWNITVVPILERGIIKYIILSLDNVTEKVFYRKATYQKNRELEAIISNMSDETIIFDKDLNVTYINKEIKGQFLKENIPIENVNDISKYDKISNEQNQLITYGNFPIQRVARGEYISNYIMIIDTPLGPAYREVNGSPMYNKDGKFSGGVMVYKDINHRMEAEELRLIKTQNELLSKVVEALDLEYVRCTYPELKIISINGNGINKLKRLNDKVKSMVYPIGKNYFAIYPVDEDNKRKALEFNLIKKEHNSYIGYENHVVDGEKRFFKTINQPIFGLNNKIVEIIFITTDITDQVNANNKMKETLDNQNQMFADISHELKTPLSMIFSSSQLIEMYLKRDLDNIVKENISRSVDIIKQNSFRFTKLINNIIDLSSMECGFYNLNFINGNIVEIVEDIVDSVRDYAVFGNK